MDPEICSTKVVSSLGLLEARDSTSPFKRVREVLVAVPETRENFLPSH